MKRLLLWFVLLPVAAATTVTAQMRTQFLGVTPVPVTTTALFDGRVVQDVRLSISSVYWQTLKDNYLEDTYYPADFRWRSTTVRSVGIRSRGTGSRSGTKPGLKVDFSQYVKGQTLLGLKSLVLRNNTQDPSGMHERLGLQLFQRMGLPAPREAHARFYVNDQYAGLYTVVEPIDKNFLSRTYDENDGYLFELDYPVGMAPYHFEYRGSDPGQYVPSPFKPQTHEDDPRPEFLERLIWTINGTTDATFRGAIAEYLDLSRFIRHVAIENFIAESDAVLGDYGMNNFYLYRFGNGTLFDFIPWDKSEAFKAGSSYGIFHNIFDVPGDIRNRLMVRVLSYPDLYDLYLNSLLDAARSASEPAATDRAGWLDREITFESEQIRAATLADPVKPYTNAEFDADVQSLHRFAAERPDVIARAVAEAREAQRRMTSGRPK